MTITIQDIETEFEVQLSRILDPMIKRKVVETWVKACKKGGWKRDIGCADGGSASFLT